MKKIILTVVMVAILALSFALLVSAAGADIVDIPANLKSADDAKTKFVVFEGTEYYTFEGTTVSNLNNGAIKAELERLGVTSFGSSTPYLAKYIFPTYTPSGEKVTKVEFDSGVKKNDYFKNGACGAFVLPEYVTTITNINDHTSQIRSVDFGKNNTISEIPFYFLNNASNLREVLNFPTELDKIGEFAFSCCNLAFQGEMYINATNVGNKAFNNAIGLGVTGIVFGPRTKNMASESFSTLERSGSKNVRYIEFQGDVTQITGIIASGDNVGAFYFEKGTQRNAYSGLVCIILSNPAQADCAGKTFQDYLPNVYFNPQSKNGGNPVMPSHSYGEATVSYKNFFASGSLSSSCVDCGCTMDGVKLDPLFVDLGYSCSQVGSPSITYCISINYGAIEYFNANVSVEKVLGEYGIVIANKELVGNTAFNEDLTEKKGAYKASFNLFGDNAYVEFKVINLVGEGYDYTDKELFLTTYFVINGEVSYYDGGKMTTTLTDSVTYNSVLNQAK